MTADEIRDALRLLGARASGQGQRDERALQAILEDQVALRGQLEQAPGPARVAFIKLVQDGPATVRDLLGRDWWGRGLLPPPLDWLQRRAMVHVGSDGRVHPAAAARSALLGTASGSPSSSPEVEPQGTPLRVEPAGCVVVAADGASLAPALAVSETGLRQVAPTVAVSTRTPSAVGQALRAAGVLDAVVAAQPTQPVLPRLTEDAVGPRAVRALLTRATTEQRQVRLEYFASSRGGAPTDRVVDPWTFDHNLLRAYCHLRQGERTFALDRVGRAELLHSSVAHGAPAD